jgi:hypothetical protein
MVNKLTNWVRVLSLTFLLFSVARTMAQDGTIYPLDAPSEPKAILLNTGGVANQPAKESWFRQWGDPMARNISVATLTPFYQRLARQMVLL